MVPSNEALTGPDMADYRGDHVAAISRANNPTTRIL